MSADIKQLILDTLSDTCANFLYYDRKEDASLPVGAIEQALANGTVTGDELVALFRTELHL